MLTDHSLLFCVCSAFLLHFNHLLLKLCHLVLTAALHAATLSENRESRPFGASLDWLTSGALPPTGRR